MARVDAYTAAWVMWKQSGYDIEAFKDVSHAECNLKADIQAALSTRAIPSAEQKVGEFTPTHRHYKGGLYQLLHEATDEYGQWQVCVYKAEDGRIWTRQKHVFNEIMPNGQPRFAALPAPPTSSQR